MAMKKVTYLIDGFNLYHSVRTAQSNCKAHTKWLDIRKVCESRLLSMRQAVGCEVSIGSIYYFSAYARHLKDPSIVKRHKAFVKCLEDSGIQVEINDFKSKDIRCPHCKGFFVKHEEKETDVSIASKLLEVFFTDECDIVAVMSGDTDLVPASKNSPKTFPPKTNFLFVSCIS